MDNSNNLSLPYIAPSQAQKHVTHNEAIRMLDTIVMLSVKSQTLVTPPNSPNEGDRFIIADAPQGIWAGHANDIVTWVDNNWDFSPPKEGWLCWDEDDKKLVIFSNNVWGNIESPPTHLNNISAIGINTAIDQNNKLSISADSTLLSHQGAGHRLAINKQATSQTASLIFQNNYTAKAEFGLLGTNDFSIKVSSNGSSFSEAISIDNTSAEVKLLNSNRMSIGDYKGTKVNYDKLYISGTSPGIRMEIERDWGGFASSLFNLKGYKSSTDEEFSIGQIGLLGNYGNDGDIMGDVDVVQYLYIGAGKNTSYNDNALKIYPNHNVWCSANMSAASFTDRTPYPKTLELAYECVQSMQRLPDGEYNENDKDLQLDHEKLHPYLVTTYEDTELSTIDVPNKKEGNMPPQNTVTKIARDLSATVSVQNEVIRDLIKRISILEEQSNT